MYLKCPFSLLQITVLQVLESEHVDAQQLLLMLPSGSLPELRALLLERIGKHQEALRWVPAKPEPRSP